MKNRRDPRHDEPFVRIVIGGKWVSGSGDGVIDVIDPATEESIGEVSEGGLKEAERAVAAARDAFDYGPWPYMTPRERSAVLGRFADVLDSRKDSLQELIIAETGCLPWLADVVQVGGAIESVRYNAEAAVHEVRWTESAPPRGDASVLSGDVIVREPAGVVAAITPFNFPFFLNLVKVVPALAVGCTVVLKPHPWTPLDAFEIAWPPRSRAAAGGSQRHHGRGRGGHPPDGGPSRRHGDLYGVHLDRPGHHGFRLDHRETPAARLGGKSARIVLDDVSEDDAAALGFGAALVHSGQGCELQTRLLLPHIS